MQIKKLCVHLHSQFTSLLTKTFTTMARQNHGPLSKAKGKIGAVVFQQYEGMQISKEYQPIVKNPQTTKQTVNRAKFKLASQFVGQFAYVFEPRLAKISSYKRVLRGTAINAIHAIVEPDTNNVATTISRIANAINAKSIQDFEAPTINTSTPGQAGIVAGDGDTVMVCVCGYNANGDVESRSTSSYTSDGTSKAFSNIGSAESVIMAVALRATNEAGRATLGNLVVGNNGSVELDINRAVADGDLLISGLVAADIVPA